MAPSAPLYEKFLSHMNLAEEQKVMQMALKILDMFGSLMDSNSSRQCQNKIDIAIFCTSDKNIGLTKKLGGPHAVRSC